MNSIDNRTEMEKINNLFIKSCEIGDLDTIIYIYTSCFNTDNEININMFDDLPFRSACFNGHIYIVEWLYHISNKDGNKPIDIHFCDELAFRSACENGHFEIAKWLYKITERNIDINANDDYAFRLSCSNNHLNIAQWLYDVSKMDNKSIDIHAHSEDAFRFSCLNGFLDAAQWLYNLSKKDNNNKIDIHAQNEYAFVYSCINGHINVVKWLYNLSQTDDNKKINIHIENDRAFISSCINNKKDIAEWLCSICSDYSIVYVDNKLIPFVKNIKTILENNNQSEISELFKDSKIKTNDNDCIVCWDNIDQYWIELDCNHLLCSKCFVNINKCPYRCSNTFNLHEINLVKKIY